MLRRALVEQRRFVVLLAAALVLDVAIYAAVVYPLGVRVAGADSRAAQADREMRTAEKEHAAAEALAGSAQRAEVELGTFYGEVLPADLNAAQRLTYVRLAELARASNLRIVRRTASAEPVQGSALDRLKIGLALQGAYEDIRKFVYELETAREFVIIDTLAIMPEREPGGDLVLTLELSTYYRASDHVD